MPDRITSNDDLIDSRDVTSRIAELEDLGGGDGYEMDGGELSELAQLKELARQGEVNASDWWHGAALIRDSYFPDYARQYAEEIGVINNDTEWPATCIDWEQAASEMQADYTDIDFAGVTYWIR